MVWIGINPSEMPLTGVKSCSISPIPVERNACIRTGFNAGSVPFNNCSIRCGPAGKRNSSVSSRSTWFALGLAIHHGSLSRVTCWLPKMILPGRQGRRRCWCEWLAVSGRGPGNGQAYPIASAFWCGIARQCLVKQFEIRLQYPNDVEECTRYFRDWS